MRLWRLSGSDYATRFDGGYGMGRDGRWNTRGRPVTYCSTGPALCVLEKLVHIDDPALLPDDTMLVRYEVAVDVQMEVSQFDALPDDWERNQTITRSMGDAWLRAVSTCLLSVPSVVVAVAETDDRNVLINHRHRDIARISVSSVVPFRYDPRLFIFD